jgi:hypothetical protein
MLQLVQRLLGRQPKLQLPPFDFARNRYRSKKKWPPNLHHLTERQAFRFERKFKRRLRMKSVRPEWNKWVKIVQWSLVGFITVYGVLFHDFSKDPMNPRPGEKVFEGLRAWFWGLGEGFWTHTATAGGRGGVLRTAESKSAWEEKEKAGLESADYQEAQPESSRQRLADTRVK